MRPPAIRWQLRPLLDWIVDRPGVQDDVHSGMPTALVEGLGGVMAEFVRFTLDDGSEVLFESAESDLVALHGGAPEVRQSPGSVDTSR